MIRYFWKGLRPFIWAQLDARDRNLDPWDKVVNKTVDAEAKVSLQALFVTREMDSQYRQGQQPTKKDDKNFKDFKKNKSSQNLPTNM